MAPPTQRSAADSAQRTLGGNLILRRFDALDDASDGALEHSHVGRGEVGVEGGLILPLFGNVHHVVVLQVRREYVVMTPGLWP